MQQQFQFQQHQNFQFQQQQAGMVGAGGFNPAMAMGTQNHMHMNAALAGQGNNIRQQAHFRCIRNMGSSINSKTNLQNLTMACISNSSGTISGYATHATECVKHECRYAAICSPKKGLKEQQSKAVKLKCYWI